ncbi:MAG: class I SAM-dependent methyltransferase [Burkholderiales bacterium]|nr:class I SAM-dependent methyltransferase [Burkholderiales bacterium]
MSLPDENAYDVLPYVSQAFAQSHPDRLATVATLFGMRPASITNARVLELGCASGGNLIPIATQLPGSRFVGIDLSARQIADGTAVISGLGLANIELRQMDIAAVDASLGKFDYIIAHGVFSWVPPAVQDKLLDICSQNLAPEGVAYVSYNTYPGWRMRGMIRDMMAYHVRPFPDITLKVQQARALLEFLAKSVPTQNNPFGLLLKHETEMIARANDAYLAHEHLEDVNEPIYFHEFMARASARGLQYLGEAELHTMLASNFAPDVAETLRKIAPDIIRMEQYMDFLRNRIFRQTLLVHQGVQINRNLDWQSVQSFHVASPAKPVSATPDLRSPAFEQFRTDQGVTLNSPAPIVKAAMVILAERWPQSIPVAELRALARRRLAENVLVASDPATLRADAEALGTELLKCALAAIVELRMQSPPMTTEVSERPRTSPLERMQADKGNAVTNLRHEPANLDEFSRQLVRHLDGTRDMDALRTSMEGLVFAGTLVIKRDGVPLTDPAAVRQVMDQALPAALKTLAKAGLFEA